MIDPIKTDIRIIKTKRAIRDATMKLLSQKSADDISITELALTAQINRKTFYNYYQNIYQVIDEIENETVEKFASTFKATDWLDGDELDFYKVFFCVTESVRDNMDFFRHLLSINRTSVIITKVEKTLKEKAIQYFNKYLDIDESLLSLAMDYVISGMFSVFSTWLQNGQKMSVAEVTDYVGMMSLGAVNSILESKNINTKKLTL
ncbi:MAG: TetR/AcrR family transcriptional regulator [Ruminococcaceae bacterium]|nr:TetR/AcrR family transcriptional regulator [Oscillospiraceae bacterium]